MMASQASVTRDQGVERSFDVEGLSCAACARRVERALAKVEGVREAQVDLVRERARIVFDGDPSRARLDAETAVERAGYRLHARERARSTTTPVRRTDLRAALAWVFTGLSFLAGALAPTSPWLELLLASVAVLGAGSGLFRKALLDLRDRAAGMEVLLALGAGSALGSAVLSAFGVFGQHHGHGHGHSDASMAALVVAVALLGKALERGARARAAEAIESILRAMPDTARVVRHGAEAELPTGEVREGDELRVAPFAHVPVDAEILAPEDARDAGTWALDESVVTGESRPVSRRVGERVLGGSVNLGRALQLRARSGGDGSELAKVLEAVSRAAAEKSPIVRATDRLAAVFAPVVMALAAFTLAFWMWDGAPFPTALRAAITVLVVACPCALGLATPVAVTVALGHLASRGVLVRDAAILEAIPRVRTLVLDKTGTLTEGAPRVLGTSRAAAASLRSDDDLLALAASVEAESHHPLARAIFEEAMRRTLRVPRATALEEIPGHGVRGRVEGVVVEVRRPDPAEDARFAVRAELADATAVEIRVEGEARLRVFFEDALRPESHEVARTLRARGIALVVRSGDAPGAVAKVAASLGIEDARGGMRPEDKLADLGKLARPVAMIGDGINDAPALARADVGFALGSRAPIALRAAGVALARSDLRLLLLTHDVARRTRRVIRENLALAFAYNLVALPFAAAGAFERLGGPGAAAAAMSLSSILVVLNALRLRAPTRAAAADESAPRSGVVSRA
jgi:P-type Cu+ transporter